jgi:hypothetical protein
LRDIGLWHDGDNFASLYLSTLKKLRPSFVLRRLARRRRRGFALGDTQHVRAGRQRLAVGLDRSGDPYGT